MTTIEAGGAGGASVSAEQLLPDPAAARQFLGVVGCWSARGEKVELRPVCAIGDSRLPDEGVPEAVGVVERLYGRLICAASVPMGRGTACRGVGLVEVDSTDVSPDQQSFPAYFPTGGVDPTDGSWRHVGWIAMLRC